MFYPESFCGSWVYLFQKFELKLKEGVGVGRGGLKEGCVVWICF